ncbi:MAG: ATP-dependent RecD-like DNA helicase [candidate division NC10 bacterium]|nr:ATP-dependent RecD-like DNA helicase [candidate division NC10 bacterium]
MDRAYTTLQGTVERITYVNEETQYVVARLDVPGRLDLATIVGNLPALTPGETLRLQGTWTSHKKYGDQFQVERYERVTPANLTGIQRYLGSGLIKGIGPVFAKRLVDAFGLGTLQIIEEEPARLRTVDGIGPLRLQRITAAWAEQKEIREVMLFLQGHGVSSAYAVKIFKAYGQAAIATVRANPYRLARDIYGIGFKTADRIAQNLGIPKDSPLRAQAGIVHVLHALADEGHVYVPEADLLREAETTLEIPRELLPEAIADLATEGEIVAEELPGGARGIYLTPLHVAEEQVARRLADLLRAPRIPVRIDVEKALEWVEGVTRLHLAPQQREAIRMALGSKALVITGGPGTGKTTILRCIIQILEKKGVRMHLASPTGRAARRMAEAAGREAVTIHRLLEWSPQAAVFQRNPHRPLETDLVIVDEASMIDVPLMNSLLRAVPLTATLLLVGDADQLPSVGPGTVLKDILDSGRIPAVRLTEIFRQAERSRIVLNAHRVNRGEFPDVSRPPRGQESDFHFLPEEDPQRLQQLIVDLACRRLPARYGLEPVEDIQVLTPMHRGVIGAAQLNAALQAALNPTLAGRAEVMRAGRVFRVGDRVMQIRNNYDKEVSNGDIGRITRITPEDQEVTVRMDGRAVTYDFSELDELTLAYAATVHKSQGSEYPAVVFPLHTTHYPMLQRTLLYTAITRARRLLVVVGTKKAVALAVKNDASQRRFSRLTDRLVGSDRGEGENRRSLTGSESPG